MTDIKLVFGDTTVNAKLNDTETARAFAEKLPVTIAVGGTGVDFCGQMPFSLPYEEAQVHNGWTNGDVNYKALTGKAARETDAGLHGLQHGMLRQAS